tara:strand:+ start:340 stop:744 length:405 start_codon:yes stop_codon:yes gene_type:complete
MKVTASEAWSILSNFSGFMEWAGIDQGKIRVEGEGIGMIRHLATPIGEIGERLTYLDYEAQQIGYEIAYGEPIGMQSYQALITVISEDHSSCTIDWSGQCIPVDPEAVEEVTAALSGSYQNMHQSLERYIHDRL